MFEICFWRHIGLNGGQSATELAQTLSEFKCQAPLHRQCANFLVLSLHQLKFIQSNLY